GRAAHGGEVPRPIGHPARRGPGAGRDAGGGTGRDTGRGARGLRFGGAIGSAAGMSASDHFPRGGVLAGRAAATAAPALAEPPTRSLRPMPRPGAVRLAAPAAVRAPQVQVAGADALIAAARLGGRVGFAVRDGNTGALLEGFDADLPLPPASVAKTVT